MTARASGCGDYRWTARRVDGKGREPFADPVPAETLI